MTDRSCEPPSSTDDRRFTTLLTEGLSIDGAGTWIAASAIVWPAAQPAAFILPFLGLRGHLEERRG